MQTIGTSLSSEDFKHNCLEDSEILIPFPRMWIQDVHCSQSKCKAKAINYIQQINVRRVGNYLIISKSTSLETSSTIIKIILPCPNELFIESESKNFAITSRYRILNFLQAKYSYISARTHTHTYILFVVPLILHEILSPTSKRFVVMHSYIFHLLHTAGLIKFRYFLGKGKIQGQMLIPETWCSSHGRCYPT